MRRLRYPVLAAVLVVSWSSGFVGVRFATDSAGVAQVLFWRSLLSGVFLLPVALRVGPRITLATIRDQASYAVLGMFLYLGGFALAIERGVPTGLVALMADLVPLAIAVLSGPVLGQRLSRRQWLGMVVGFGGVLVVSADAVRLGDAPIWAYVLPAIAMVSFAVSIVWQEHRHDQPTTIPQRLSLQCLAAAVMFAPFAAATGGLAPPRTAQFAFGMVWLVVVATYGAWLTYYFLLRRYPAARVTSTIYLSPPLTMVWAWAMFDDPLSVAMAVGSVITLAGVALVASSGEAEPETIAAP